MAKLSFLRSSSLMVFFLANGRFVLQIRTRKSFNSGMETKSGPLTLPSTYTENKAKPANVSPKPLKDMVLKM